MKIEGKRVLITGGAGGIGMALARAFIAGGARVILAGRSPAKLLAAAEQLGGATELAAVDMADVESVRSLPERAPDVDILVNNAGILLRYNLADETERGELSKRAQLFQEEIATNFTGPALLCLVYLPTLVARAPESAIVNVSSGLALAPREIAPLYSATKAALHSFSIGLRYQLERAGLPVFEILPPLVNTAMTAERAAPDGIEPEALARDALQGLQRDVYEIRVGKVQLLGRLLRLAPRLAHRLVRI